MTCREQSSIWTAPSSCTAPASFPRYGPSRRCGCGYRCRQGSLLAAADWAHERGVTLTDAAEPLREYDHLTLVRLRARRAPRQSGRRGARASYSACLSGFGRRPWVSGPSRQPGRDPTWSALSRTRPPVGGSRHWPRSPTFSRWLPNPKGYARLILDEGAPSQGPPPGRRHRPRRPVSRHDACSRSAYPRPHPAHRITARHNAAGRPAERARAAGAPVARQRLQRPRDRSCPVHLTQPPFTHTKHVFTKLGASSRREAVARARERGLLAGADGRDLTQPVTSSGDAGSPRCFVGFEPVPQHPPGHQEPRRPSWDHHHEADPSGRPGRRRRRHAVHRRPGQAPRDHPRLRPRARSGRCARA